ncbi:probable proline-serine-threonine phosphatase-interacting protein 2 [Phialocephala subalpina]|uniref:Probable proline-serine-threonine phosphatase-interacting protein 2 n=1 Tax=Phialocephala subalpina TaxID=576137 RepID=A0A1L7X846_9HELO|nr:probable proline-serine-threonine phosphatase-interacting protein 2 [Phialocephala subalpina]
MPGTVSDGPSVQVSFANNFWGKDDAGVDPLLQRMHNAKQTCDELKSFYTARAAIEDEYARKLLSLSRKPLGSQESGTLRASLDVLRGEVEAMGKSHQNIAGQMKTELEEPLAAFAGAMKERRKIVQGGIEKLLKVKTQQTQHVNKTRDKYEQECLKIKGYLAQGHMVMGQEERKNKAKLEKTQINLATSNTEYENAVKALEETTGRWNRDWKAAADKFQDLEEERLDFMKSSLWSFANIASTVCVSDDASCEKVRLSLENCEVEKDIASFIKEQGTGQEIPDPPKYINFCRGDISDTQSEASEDDSYSVAQFPRTINPAYRTSSPQPSTYESHHDPHSAVARELGHDPMTPPSREATLTPHKGNLPSRDNLLSLDKPQIGAQPTVLGDRRVATPIASTPTPHQPPQSRQPPQPRQGQLNQAQPNRISYEQAQHGPLAAVPHDPYPMDGMTMLCRTGPPSASDRSSAHSPGRPSSRDSNSEYSNPTSFSSQEPPSGKNSPTKQVVPPPEKQVLKKKSGFFQSHSPFRRKSNKEKENSVVMTPSSRNTWSASRTTGQSTPSRRPQLYGQDSQNMISDRPSGSPEPIDPRASFQLNVGNNVFDVATPDQKKKATQNDAAQQEEDLDPIAQALAELKGVTKASSTRVSADNYHGIPTPAPGSAPTTRPGAALAANGALMAGMRGTPPPSYDQPVSRLGAPQPAFTSKQMNQVRQKYVDQTQNMFNTQARPGSQAGGYGSGSHSRPGTRGSDMPRATSPAPPRSVSPRPNAQVDTRQAYRSASPNPYGGSQRKRTQSATSQNRGSDQAYYRHNSPNDVARAVSPAPFRDQERPSSSRGNDMSMQMQLAPAGDEGYGSQNGRGSRAGGSASSRAMSYYGGSQGEQQLAQRSRSKSVADVRQFSRDGRPILHFARAMYMYQAAIPEELSFAKGDILAVLRLQDDGWWEAEVTGKNGRPGLVPSNYLQNC